MYPTLVAFHVLAAAVWIGGTVALVFAGVPAIRTLPMEQRAPTVRVLGRRWKPMGWTALAVLGASGAWLAFRYWGADDSDLLFHSQTGHLLIAKAVLYLLLVASSFTHDFVLGPRLNRQMREGRPQTLRRPMQIVGWCTFALTLVLPILGVLITT
ncbi:MAG: CopD family protein [Gaiellales bacterium]